MFYLTANWPQLLVLVIRIDRSEQGEKMVDLLLEICGIQSGKAQSSNYVTIIL